MSLKPFPLISETQFVLIRDDLYTGHVMDKDMKLAVNDAQEIWTVFDDLAQVIEEASRIVKEYDFIECMIFNRDNKLIKRIAPE